MYRLAADWPPTMQIVRVISQDHMNNKQYVGKADFLVFRALNQHGFLGQLQEKKLSFLNDLHILPSRKRPVSILHDVSGIIKPCRMTLLLGPPGSRKTTLLFALAGKLDKDLKVTGKITYNGHRLDKFIPQRTSAYISQHDLHIREMTVRETLAFLARCQGVGTRYEMLMELSRREKAANIKPDPDVDVYMKIAANLRGQL
ncbi:pleiotropic drug resistance protein TUR2-like [Magnolia sinica]|uniref:pleiotropic drug resistance protein TUR2-like n=1 Tax=Magnolia sinica TaxID=86752 RepID=UPI0026590BB1|nr:pleiotropic drug resistance protein TUR2-like [Magnolia sinica]